MVKGANGFYLRRKRLIPFQDLLRFSFVGEHHTSFRRSRNPSALVRTNTKTLFVRAVLWVMKTARSVAVSRKKLLEEAAGG
jgi:hypothetical protein